MLEKEKLKIVLTGGGSGGHVFPLLAVGREIKRIFPQRTELYYLGPKDRWVDLYLSEEEIKIKGILAGKLRRYLTPKSVLLNLLDLFKLGIGFVQGFFTLFFINPDLVFSKGGFGSIPALLSAKILAIPVFAHESDIRPGLANRVGAKLAFQTFTSFPRTEYLNPRKTIQMGNPVRRNIFGGSSEKSEKMFNLTGEKPVLLILPGSQGSQRINDMVLLVLNRLLRTFEVIHQCGAKNLKQVKMEAEVAASEKLMKYYHLYSFLNEKQLRESYFAADLVVSRGGAGNIFEAAALEKALVIIPLPESAQGHQYENAYALERKKAAVVLEEKNITPQFFLEKLEFLIEHEEKLEELRQNIARFARPKAAKEIAHYLLEYLLV